MSGAQRPKNISGRRFQQNPAGWDPLTTARQPKHIDHHSNRTVLKYAQLRLLSLLCSALSIWGQNVDVRAGNIFYTDAAGTSRQITFSGIDAGPTLSFDGKQIIFVRQTSTPAGFEEPTDLHPMRTQIWIADVNGANPKMVFGGPVVVGKSRYATFSEPRLAPDNNRAYFLIHYAVVQFGLVRLDLNTGKVRMISGSLDWEIVGTGRYAGDLVVQKRKAYPGGFSNSFWLISPDGIELGYVGPSDKEAKEFLKNPNRSVRPRRP